MSDRWQRDRVVATLGAYEANDVSLRVTRRRAAVAALLRWHEDRPWVLMMKRADRQGARWSGHVSFPGGRAEPEDRDLLHTAVRETAEEIGYDLEAGAKVIGRLDDVMAVARGKVVPMAIRPFVFEETAPQPIALGDEAAATFWLPLDDVGAGRLDDTMVYRLGPVPMDFPCWRYDGYVVWGLTYKMITQLMSVLRI